MIRRPPRSTLFPYTTLFRSVFRAVAAVGFAPEFIAFLDAHPITPGRGNLTGRVALEGRTVHILDTIADPEYTLTERSEEHTSELQSPCNLVCRLLLEKKKKD